MNTPIAITRSHIEGATTHRLSGVPAPPPLPRGRWPLPTKRDPYGLQRIADATAEAFGITCDFMLHGGKEERAVFPRMVAMYLCVKKCSCYLGTIGNFFRKHHTTIMHARDTITDRIETEPNTKRIVQELLNAL